VLLEEACMDVGVAEFTRFESVKSVTAEPFSS
jgi:hypothetical protein